MANETQTDSEEADLREALADFTEQARRGSESPAEQDEDDASIPVLGPAARWYGDNVLDPAAQWSEEQVLEPAAQWYGDNVLEPAAQWSQEHVPEPVVRWWTEQLPKLPDLPEFPDLPEPPFSPWDIPRAVEDEFQRVTGIPGWDDVLRRVRRELDKIGPRIEPLTDGPQIPTPEDDANDPAQDPDDGWDWGWDWLGFLAIAAAAYAIYEWIDGEPSLLSVDVKFTLPWGETVWSDEGEVEIVRSVESTTKLFWSVPMAARVGDIMGHGKFALPGPGSETVYFGGEPALLPTDQVACGVALPAPHAPAGFVTKNAKVFIHGQPALRAGDFQNEGPGGPNPIVGGCETVWVGDPAPAVHVTTQYTVRTVVRREPSPWKLRIRASSSIDGEVNAGVSWLGPYIGFEGKVNPLDLVFELSYEPKWLTDQGKRISVASIDVKLLQFDGLARAYTSWVDVVALRPALRKWKVEAEDLEWVEVGDPTGPELKDSE